VNDADQCELVRLITELTWRIDHGRAATVHELFVDDGELVLGPEEVVRGREAITEWGQTIDEAGWRIRHVISNMRFSVDADDAAEGTTLVTAFMHERDELGTAVPWTVGEDHDRFVRTEQGWRFASRRWEQLFLRPA
jgi:SnoaL-like domain